LKAGKIRKFVTMQDNSAVDREEIKDNVMYVQEYITPFRMQRNG